jgi:hypothetical protein
LVVEAGPISLHDHRALSQAHPWLPFYKGKPEPLILLFDVYRKQFTDTVNVRLFDRQSIQSTWLHGPDSVFVLFRANMRPGRVTDSTVVQFGRRGNVVQTYLPSNLNFPSHNRPFNTIDEPLSMQTATSQAFHVCGNRLYFNVFHFKCWPCKPNCSTRDQPLAGYLDLTTQKGHLLPVFFPEYVAKQHCWPSVHREPYLVSNHRGELVVGFSMRPRYLILDTATNRVKQEIEVPWSRFVDTIRGIPYGQDGKPVHDEQFDPVEGEYVYFQFDPFRQRYLRWIRLPKHGRRPMIELNRDRFALAVYDSSFRLLGEGLLPEACQPTVQSRRWLSYFVTPEGYWFLNTSHSDTSRKVYNRFELNFGESLPSKLKNNPYPEGMAEKSTFRYTESWPDYLREVQGIGTPDGAWLVVQTVRGCPSCRQEVLRQYGLLRDSLPQLQLNLLVVGPQHAELKLDSLTRGHRHFSETKFRHHTYVRETGNPRLLILRKGRLERNYELNPAEVLIVPVLLGDYLKGRKLPRPEEL